MPTKRVRPARFNRPQVYTADYITTSFGPIRKREIRNAVVWAFIIIGGFEFGFYLGYLVIWA